ncbi:hypothetical protein HMPREF0101_00798 [Bacteroides fragilis]|nr:hypothetical protein HMPREF0101_00798 [Bacteroides fragilis]
MNWLSYKGDKTKWFSKLQESASELCEEVRKGKKAEREVEQLKSHLKFSAKNKFRDKR